MGDQMAAYSQIYFDFLIIFWTFIYNIILQETEKTEVFEKNTVRRSRSKAKAKLDQFTGQKFKIYILQRGHKDKWKLSFSETREGKFQLWLEQKIAVEGQRCQQVQSQLSRRWSRIRNDYAYKVKDKCCSRGSYQKYIHCVRQTRFVQTPQLLIVLGKNTNSVKGPGRPEVLKFKRYQRESYVQYICGCGLFLSFSFSLFTLRNSEDSQFNYES